MTETNKCYISPILHSDPHSEKDWIIRIQKLGAVWLTFIALLSVSSFAATKSSVTLQRSGDTITLANGLIEARISTTNAAVLSLTYKGISVLGVGDRQNGYWSMPGTSYVFGSNHELKIIDDPATNHGKRGTFVCRFGYDGKSKTVPADVEIKYSLGRNDRALYLEATWQHKPDYPQLSFPVGRFAAKLNDSVFDWMTVDSRRNFEMISAYDWNHGTELNLKEARLMNSGVLKGHVEHKYDYSAVQFDVPAYGWSSTKDHIGIWIVNPSYEYMSGGPTKLELTTHRDATFTKSLTDPAPPTLLNIWKGPHYGGTSLVVPRGESWTKVIGPFLLYVNAQPTHDAMWHDALRRAAAEQRKWPYSWAVEANYPPADKRATVTGRIILHDPGYSTSMKHLLVGLTHADYEEPNGEKVDWQRDGKYYQFWTRARKDGRFEIRSVRPGYYTLHAFADGVLGEYAKANIQVLAGQSIHLGSLQWTPVRYGRQLWEIGYPDHTAGEFLHGDHYWRWGIYNEYPKDFPHDVIYTIGQSNFHKDWNLMQVPRAHDETGKTKGDSTTWTVNFDLPHAETGQATLRLSFAGTEAHSLTIGINGQQIAELSGFRNTSVIHRDSDRGYWTERMVSFDASMLKMGHNTLTLTLPAGNVMSGIEYDYLRLEVNEHSPSFGMNRSPAQESY